MPKYKVEISSGKAFEIEAERDQLDSVVAELERRYAKPQEPEREDFAVSDPMGSGFVSAVADAGAAEVARKGRSVFDRLEAPREFTKEEGEFLSSKKNIDRQEQQIAKGNRVLEAQSAARDKASQDYRPTDLIKDTGIGLAKGGVGIAQAVVGLQDLLNGGASSRVLQQSGVDFEKASEWLSSFQSDLTKAQRSEVQQADGFLDTLAAVAVRPAALIDTLAESAPMMLASGGVGGLAARGVAATAAREAAKNGLKGEAAQQFIVSKVRDNIGLVSAAARATEGGIVAGQIAQEAASSGRDWSDFAAPAVAGGVASSLIAKGGQKLGNKLGALDAETAIAARTAGLDAATVSQASMLKTVGVDALSEGVFQELPQSVAEQAASNLAMGRPVEQGLGAAAAQGLVAGSAFGGAAGASRAYTADAADARTAAIQAERERIQAMRRSAPAAVMQAGSVDEAIDIAMTATATQPTDIPQPQGADLGTQAPEALQSQPQAPQAPVVATPGPALVSTPSSASLLASVQGIVGQAESSAQQGVGNGVLGEGQGRGAGSTGQVGVGPGLPAQDGAGASTLPGGGRVGSVMPGTGPDASAIANAPPAGVAVGGQKNSGLAPASAGGAAEYEPNNGIGGPGTAGDNGVSDVPRESRVAFERFKIAAGADPRAKGAKLSSWANAEKVGGSDASVIGDIAKGAAEAFGLKIAPVQGLGKSFGVAFDGHLFINTDRATAPKALVSTVGHESYHALEQSSDPLDRKAAQSLRTVVLQYVNDGVVQDRRGMESKAASRQVSRDYAISEVVADVNGDMWTDPKFWGRVYELDNGSTMRRVFYKFMQGSTKLLSSLKGLESFRTSEAMLKAEGIDAVREVAAQVWAERAGRANPLNGMDGTAAFSAGALAEVAPNPDMPVADRWRKQTPEQRLSTTRSVAEKTLPKIFDAVGASGWKYEIGSGKYQGEVNPNVVLVAPDGTSDADIERVTRAVGYAWDQKAMVAFDEENTTSDSQAGFVKVMIPKGMSEADAQRLREHIASTVPQADSDTVRGGGIVIGNFSEWNDSVETLTDEQFDAAIVEAVNSFTYPVPIPIQNLRRYHSKYIEPSGREAYLEGVDDGAGNTDSDGRAVLRAGGQGGYLDRLSAAARESERALDSELKRYGFSADLGGAESGDRAAGGAADTSAARGAPGREGGLGRPDAGGGAGYGIPQPPDAGQAAGGGAYGSPIEGASSAVGFHFSRQARKSLSSAYYGTGLKGAEAERLNDPKNADIKPRIFFYVDKGRGVQPEFGVGPHPHSVRLDNLYNVTDDALGIVRAAVRGIQDPLDRASAFERAVMEAGFDGYLRTDAITPQGFAILVGAKHSAVPVAPADPKRLDGKANIAPAPQAQPERTRTEGSELVRRPTNEQVRQIIRASNALKIVAPSFKMQWGEARVDAREAAVANAALLDSGSTFQFSSELGGFNSFSDLTDDSYDVEPEELSPPSRAELMAELRNEQQERARINEEPRLKDVQDAGIHAEDAVQFGEPVTGNGIELPIPDYLASIGVNVEIPGRANDGFRPRVSGGAGELTFHTTDLMTAGGAVAFAKRQAARVFLQDMNFDLASTYRSGTIKKIANTWESVAAMARGMFRLGMESSSDAFGGIAKDIGAFDGYTVRVDQMSGGLIGVELTNSAGRTFNASIAESRGTKQMECCTMGLSGSNIGTDFYAVATMYAKSRGLTFVADRSLSNVNSYRRVEQALSYALKTGDSFTFDPGPQARVYGWKKKGGEAERVKNIARLALANLRNAEELFPDIRRYAYLPKEDRFVDSRGNDAEPAITAALADKDARALGLGRSTLARAAITSQIIKGDFDEFDARSFAKPIAYSVSEFDGDPATGETWGSFEGGEPKLNPELKKFLGSSQIMDGKLPRMGYHGTSRDITTFRAKQAGAIFITFEPPFAERFSYYSQQWMFTNPDQVMSPDDLKTARQAAADRAMADALVPMSRRREIADLILGGSELNNSNTKYLAPELDKFMPAAPNIMPVFVRSESPFDYENKAHVEEVLDNLFESESVLVSPSGGTPRRITKDTLRSYLSGGEWPFIEAPEVQLAIRDLEFDGFWVKEDGVKNLAVYRSSQIKSAIGNVGAYGQRAVSEDEASSLGMTADEANEAQARGDIRFSANLAEKWATEVLAGRSKNPGYAVMDSPPVPMQMFGLGRSLPVAMKADMVRHLGNRGRSNDAPKMVRSVVLGLASPRAVISYRAEGVQRYEAILDHRDNSGRPLLVSLRRDELRAGQRVAAIADIKTMYTKDDSLAYVLRHIKGGSQVWLPEKEIARVRDFTGGSQFPNTAEAAAQPRTSVEAPLRRDRLEVSQATPFMVYGDKAAVKYAKGGNEWMALKERVSVSDADIKRAGSAAFSADIGQAGESGMDTLRRKLQDYFLPVKRVQQAILSSGGVIGEINDVYSAEERSYGRIEEALRDFRQQFFDPMVRKIVAADLTMDDLALYAYAKHAPVRNAAVARINKAMPDGGSGMTNQEAKDILDKFDQEGKTAALDDAHQDLMAITATTRRTMLDNDLIDQEEYDRLEGLFPDGSFVPLRGFENADLDGAKVGRGGKGFNIRGKETTRMLGRRTRAADIIENIVGDYERAVSRGERNLVAKTFLQMVQDNPDPTLWEIDVERTRQSFNRQSGKVNRSTEVDSGPDTIAIKLQGKEVYVKVYDELVLRAMRKASKDETGEVERFLNATMGQYTSLLRASLTQYNPAFAAVNAVRDFQQGGVSVLDELGGKGVALYAKHYRAAVAAAARHQTGTLGTQGRFFGDPQMDRYFEEFRATGGTTGGWYAKSPEQIRDEIRNVMLAAGAQPKGAVEKIKTLGGSRAGRMALRGVQSLGAVLEFTGGVSENAARVAAYRAAREMGKTPAEAASIAKNLTTNFNRKGEWSGAINAAYIFFNAAVQGTARTVKALRNPKVLGLMGGMGALGALTAILGAAGGDDEDGQPYWDKIPAYEKERNLIIMLPPGTRGDGVEQLGKDGRYLKIPMPYGFNTFPLLGMALVDVARNFNDKTHGLTPAKAAGRMVSAIMGSFNPFGGDIDFSNPSSWGQAAAPTMVDLFIQQATGTNGFSRPTSPPKSNFDDSPDSEYVNPRLAGSVWHQMARGLNSISGGNQAVPGAIDVNPGSIENLWKQATGGTGSFIADLFVNIPTKLYTGADITPRDIPVYKAFYSILDGNTDIGLMYERRALAEMAENNRKRSIKGGMPESTDPTEQALAELGRASGRYTKRLAMLRKEEIEVMIDESKTKTQKQPELADIRKRREEIAQEYNERFNETMGSYLKK